jgi:uncharacterized protein
MTSTILTFDHFQLLHWSGGTTKELFIFPPTADYKLRNFQFRLSTATVETDRSDFTLLPGVSRKLMVLEGSITLHHQDDYSRELDRFHIHSFEGDRKTSCTGRCTDFNLMTMSGTKGELNFLEMEKEDRTNYQIKQGSDWFFMYVYSGSVSIHTPHASVLHQGDLLVLQNPGELLEIHDIGKSVLVFAEISVG